MDLQEREEEKTNVTWLNSELYCGTRNDVHGSCLARRDARHSLVTWDIPGKSGVHMVALSKRVRRPKMMTNYKEVTEVLTRWDTTTTELIKMQGQDVSGLANLNACECLVPMCRRDGHDRKFSDAWKWVVTAACLHREWRTANKSDDDMGVGVKEGLKVSNKQDTGGAKTPGEKRDRV